MVDFTPFPKIARLNRDITITEKIDGTNAAVVIGSENHRDDGRAVSTVRVNGEDFLVYAQSRTRFILPEPKSADNFGFAAWVANNAERLVATLGEGIHFGEWWGKGIQRGYGAQGRHFSLFAPWRYAGDEWCYVPGLSFAPVLYAGEWSDWEIEDSLRKLRDYGSQAALLFGQPAEGIVIHHHQAGVNFKITLENDAAPKSLVRV